MIDIKLPKRTTGASDKERLSQVESYLYQLVEQLQFALNSVDTSASPAYVITQTATSSSSGSSSVDAQATFNAVKGLIIKSADIVEAYYNEISTRLSGAYVAESDFGSYAELTEQNISTNSTEIESVYNHIQSILTEIENIEYTLIDTHAHIRSGLLYYDDGEIPIYGLEIGQKNVVDGEEVFNKFARFTAGRLSFYDQNDTEVAYISDYKLYITNAEVTGSLKLGGFIIDTTKGFTLKWAGRG